ncbi:YHYH domain-containing protein (plasmid) [Novosphingobium resinovorum]|uniref:YHYH domain-containing protein n=1 Tax=Novosphingobium TaxID=165696 RepID=UPI001B3C8A05|nr:MULTISPECIES: YHYH domain-containing protein [Novosphingobium]MBF7015060.1 YHYH domain-containing protein [Novosphingobium sp. HR1a]WJM29744.1 YHYH domain-containing protein [Novosphingobium resinovorum]
MTAILAICAIVLSATPALAHEDTNTAKPTAIAAPATKPQQGQSQTPQHSGGTDANGCHKNHSTGEYHCHRPK